MPWAPPFRPSPESVAPAERRQRVGHQPGVDDDHAGLQLVGHAERPIQVAGVAVPDLLADLARPRPRLTGVKLREILGRGYGIKVASTGNRYPVDPNKIRACSARRAADEPDDRSGLTGQSHRNMTCLPVTGSVPPKTRTW